MRIAMVTFAWHDHGGIERCVQAEAAWLAAEGHEVHVFAASFEGTAPEGVRFHRVAAPAKPWALRMTAFAWLAPRAVEKAGAFDVVHAHCAYLGEGHIAHAHSVHRRALAHDRPTGAFKALRWWISSLPPLMRRVSDRTFTRAGHCIAISQAIALELREDFAAGPERVSLIYYGVAFGQFHALAASARAALRRRLGLDDGVWAVFCGWNWRRKGLDILLDALASCPGVRVAVVGEDPMEGREFRAEAARRGLQARVLFAGRQADPSPWFQAADLFAFPTRYEPFGMVVTEAMACGMPVLVPRSAGAAETVRDARALQVLAGEDPVRALAKALRALSASGPLRRRLGAANRRALGRLTWQAHGRALLGLYRRLAERPAS